MALSLLVRLHTQFERQLRCLLGVDVRSGLSRVIIVSVTFTFYIALGMTHNHPLVFCFFANKVELIHALWDTLRINLLPKNHYAQL